MRWDVQNLEGRLFKLGIEVGGIFPAEARREMVPGGRVLLCERDPKRFLAVFFAALREKCDLFLTNPDWSAEQFCQVLENVRPHFIAGRLPHGSTWKSAPFEIERSGGPAIMIPTGGTTGGVRFAIHTWETLGAAAAGFQAHFGGKALDQCCVLPLFHVSGLMQAVRALVSGGDLVFPSYAAFLKGEFPAFRPETYFLSLVPTQLTRILSSPGGRRWLRRFRRILLGGGPAGKPLLEAAREARLPLSPSYGLTESAALVALLEAEDFLAGKEGAGRPLPHAAVSIVDSQGDPASALEKGRIVIEAESLFHGYYPHFNYPAKGGFRTEDEGYIDEEGILHVAGRLDRTIISGGEKINPVVVESALLRTGLVSDVAVLGLPDPLWGEKVAAVYVPSKRVPPVDEKTLQSALESSLAAFEIPKAWVSVERIPRTPLGKLDRDRIDRLCL